MRWNFEHETTICARFTKDSARVACLSRDLKLIIWLVSDGTLANETQSLDHSPFWHEHNMRYGLERLSARRYQVYGPAAISPELSLVAVADITEVTCGIHVFDLKARKHLWFLGWHVMASRQESNGSPPRLASADDVSLSFSSDAGLLGSLYHHLRHTHGSPDTSVCRSVVRRRASAPGFQRERQPGATARCAMRKGPVHFGASHFL